MVVKFFSAVAILCFATASAFAQFKGGNDLGARGFHSPAASAPSFVGPGDLVSGARAWYGLRAYNAAYAAATGNVGIFRRSSDNATCTGIVNTVGDLDLTTTYCSGTTNLPTFCGASAGNCFVARLYDQSGALACAGATACDVVQATAANQPQLVFNCVGTTKPCLLGTAVQLLSSVTTITINVPFTFSAAAEMVSPIAQHNAVFGGNGVMLEFNNSGPVLDYNGTSNSLSIVTSTWYASALTAATSSTILYANALTPNTVGSTAGGTGTWTLNLMSRGDCCDLAGNLTEVGEWGVTFTPTQANNMIANQRTYWGF